MQDVIVTVRQAGPGEWDWQVDWAHEKSGRSQRSSGTSSSFDVAVDRARHEVIFAAGVLTGR
jgi:hypothetical protein